MRYRLRSLLIQFSIRDVIWLTLVVASLTAWWNMKRENAVLRSDNVAKAQALEVKSQALASAAAAAAKKEATLRQEAELYGQMARNRQAELAKRTAELNASLERREEVLKALRTLKDEPASAN
jgi:hypothetical protein